MVNRHISEFLATDDAEAGHAMRKNFVGFRLREGEGADLRRQIFWIGIARDKVGQRLGV